MSQFPESTVTFREHYLQPLPTVLFSPSTGNTEQSHRCLHVASAASFTVGGSESYNIFPAAFISWRSFQSFVSGNMFSK
jgi:hypothetical protein